MKKQSEAQKQARNRLVARANVKRIKRKKVLAGRKKATGAS